MGGEKEREEVLMYLLCAYPVDSAIEGSGPIGDSGMISEGVVGEKGAAPMQALILPVNAKVLGRPAWQRRRSDIVSI